MFFGLGIPAPLQAEKYDGVLEPLKPLAKKLLPEIQAAKLTETMLLGIVALRAGQSKKILYDGAKMQVTNVPEANRWLTREYRQGWQPWSASETVPVMGG